MHEVNLGETYRDLANEITIGSAADGELKVTEFFRIFAQLAAENGDCPDLDYRPVLSESGAGYRVDGMALDLPEGGEEESGDLHLAVCLHLQDSDMPVINAREVDACVSLVERFLKVVQNDRSVEAMEESSHAYQVAMQIRHYRSRISRVRLLVLTNAHLKTRRKEFETRYLDGLPLQVNVLDLERYERISRSGSDPVQVDFSEDFGGAVPCLPASMGDTGISSYLFAMRGSVLAKVFASYGNRLLEQNVRTYLQAKTSVNKGILKTIAENPSMFFAYNNGLTGTASAVSTERGANGALTISRIKDFQIVNGGQTTASMLYARDAMNCSLDEVYVQVKLSVVGDEWLGEVVPKISEYANTQNKVSLADLASNSPVQVRIERLSKEVSVPQRPGVLFSTRWFYERTRGQYKALFAYKTTPQRIRLEAEYPKAQLISKTDLSKFELAFDGRPHHVAEGEQKCFQRYVKTVLATYGDGLELNEFWFKCAVAKAIVFTSVDREIAKSEWYKASKGLKAQTTAYTVSALAQAYRMRGMQVDLLRIWRDQAMSSVLMAWTLELAKGVHVILNNPPGSVKNATEFCKKDFCWNLHVLPMIPSLPRGLLEYGISLEDVSESAGQGRRDERRNRELDFEIAVAKLVPKALEIRQLAHSRQLLSENSARALDKLQAGRLNLVKAEKNSLKTLLNRLEIEY